MVSSFESFRTNKPSLFNLETIEPSVLYLIHKDDLSAAVNSLSKLKDTVNEFLSTRLYHYQKLFLSRIKIAPNAVMKS